MRKYEYLKLIFIASIAIFSSSGIALSQENSKKPEDLFLLHKKPLSSYHQKHIVFDLYREAVIAFPDIAACRKADFNPEEVNIKNNRLIFKTKEEFEVCHFWYFSGVKNKQTLANEFILRNGLDLFKFSLPFNPRKGEIVYHTIQGGWRTKYIGLPFGQNVREVIETQHRVYAANISIVTGDSDELLEFKLSLSVL